ncbi:SHOCT domain-containing protein [Actinophytocola gossypii]|uniref:SHOCT domain-containing protein n=1 Tax=Actinophytocola gossypii TaxID=2812003 RepID=A0ABT2J3W9_9PSEU|nr:SHOCT domain-containing protein [Actinophytocola gossypii]MCT2582371.1 hypothetical protein [Actinophytocola gossypii]
MQLLVGGKVKDKRRDAWLASLAHRLQPGEQVLALVRNGLLRPLCDGLAVTNARILAFYGAEVEFNGARLEVFASDLARVEIDLRRGSHYLVAHRRSGDELVLGSVDKQDATAVRQIAEQLCMTGTPTDLQGPVLAQVAEVSVGRDRWDQVEVIGNAPSEEAWQTLRDHATPDEAPLFVIGTGAGGVFAAFTDRCMIVKVGALTAITADSRGDGRATTFPYGEITAIEYKAGLASGVLEILTPGHRGTADANDISTLSNTLPLSTTIYRQVASRLDELRARITEAKRLTANVPVSGQSTLVDELAKLATLRQQGVLTEVEFAAAKQVVISRHGSA